MYRLRKPILLVILGSLVTFMMMTSSSPSSYSSLEGTTTLVKHSITATNSDWAYVFLLADVDPDETQPSYRGMLYNILAATWVLTQQHGTVADIVVWVQMRERSPTDIHNGNVRRLPPSEEALMSRLNIQVRYYLSERDDYHDSTMSHDTPSLHRNNNNSSNISNPKAFDQLVMAKFVVLDMVEYSKVVFLDSDVLPLCGMDYLFKLESDILLHAMYEDPVNAGVFLVKPERGLKDRLMMHWRAFQARPKKPWVQYSLWDGQQGNGWDFYCAESDQGFLLFCALFVAVGMNVSIIIGPDIHEYNAVHSATRIPLTTQRKTTNILSTQKVFGNTCFPSMNVPKWAQNASPQASSFPFYRDFFHMVGYSKAWESAPRTWQTGMPLSSLQSSRDYWYYCLSQVSQQADPRHIVIPESLEELHQTIGKPKIRGDLIFSPK